MAAGTLGYSIGNEHDPGDPWGRSELAVGADGHARLTQHFSRTRTVGAWTGQVDADALATLWATLDRAGFPAVPAAPPPVPGATLRRLTVERDGTPHRAVVAGRVPTGYAETFDLLDGIIRQLSDGAVPYPSTQPAIVRDVVPVPAPATPDGRLG
ncbi:hypothetical protein [Micromonospora echinofusca]|uniref:Uncharacterized protein n=1 Tax=Micromonospora echinofusca TaxID=47858 RepID=A0ABS3VT02_MICEH|nr:hypothetical protein [Micromonospora echinofusca]MBO4207498.1 hypothetical protein [Micromonospora echinofusca]